LNGRLRAAIDDQLTAPYIGEVQGAMTSPVLNEAEITARPKINRSA